MRAWIAELLHSLQARDGWPGEIPVEHGIEQHRLRHEVWLTTPPVTARPRVVVLHPEACGCDALSEQLVLHG